MFLTNKRMIAFKTEASAYEVGGETLSSTDAFFRANELKYSPSLEEAKRKYSTGDFASYASVMGKRECEISFSIDAAWSGTASVAPEFGPMLESCGYVKSGTGTTIYTLGSTQPNKTATITVYENNEAGTGQLAIKMAGAVGDVKFTLAKVGDPLKLAFTFKGVLVSITDASGFAHGTFLATTPDAVLAATITAFTEALDLDKITIDTGNKVEMVVDPSNASGFRGAVITGREPKVTADPLLATIASRGIYARWTGGTTGALSMTVGSHLTITAPAMQILKAYDGGDRNGVVVNSMNCLLARASDSSDAEIVITQA